MWALDQPYAPRAERLLAGTPLALLAVLAVGAAVAMLLVEASMLPAHAVRVIGVTAGQGGLLVPPLAPAPPRPAARVVALAPLRAAAPASAVAAPPAAPPLAPPPWVFLRPAPRPRHNP